MVISFCLCGLVEPAQAQSTQHPLGVGLQLGDPAAFTAKLWLTNENALQFFAGWHYVRRYYTNHYYYGAPTFAVDWVHQFGRFGPAHKKVSFGVHLGVGGSLDWIPNRCYVNAFGREFCDGPLATVRMPVALNIYFQKIRLEPYAELMPGIGFIPFPFFFTLYGGVGVRYYF